jgi:glucose/arabinose dehydrogenase
MKARLFLPLLLLILQWVMAKPIPAQSTAAGTLIGWGAPGWEAAQWEALTNIVGMACSSVHHGVALDANGTVHVWGNNFYGQMDVPGDLTNAIAVAAGAGHCLALRGDGTVVAWGGGMNFHGEVSVPAGLNHVVAIGAGMFHSLALQQNGTVVGWGATGVPVDLTNAVAIAAGQRHSLAVNRAGLVIAWGDNAHNKSTVPEGLSNVVAVAAGMEHSLALKADGTVVLWGMDSTGLNRVPARLSNVVAIAAGAFHSAALQQDAQVICWGDNEAGQLDTPRNYPGFSGIYAGPSATFSITPLPVFIIPPQPVTAPAGSDVALSVKAIGRDWMLYQWYSGETPVAGQTNSIFSLTNIQDGVAGDYHVRVANTAGAVVSAPAAIVVTAAPPAIKEQPQNATAVAGTPIQLLAEVRGSEPISYQWRHKNIILSGETNSWLTLTNLGSAEAGDYQVTASNIFGEATSRSALVTVLYPPALSQGTLELRVPAGTNITLSVVAQGTPPMHFTWFQGAQVLLAEGSTNLTLADVQIAQSGAYSIMVSNLYGVATQTVAQLTVWDSLPFYVRQPDDQLFISGGRAFFSAEVRGSRPLSYQWFHGQTPIPGATNRTLALGQLTASQIGSYQVQSSNSVGAVISQAAQLLERNSHSNGVDWPLLAFREIVSGLIRPAHITHAGDGSGRLFVAERQGTVRIIQGTNLWPVPFLNITNRVRVGSEGGLMSIAFPADYLTSRAFYVNYCRKPDGATVVARYQSSSDGSLADPASEEVLFTHPQPTSINVGGQIAFGPDGFLYLGIGDGGTLSSQSKLAQDKTSLFGKLLRIDVSNSLPTYAIPPGNPFASNGNGRPEVWAIGLNNPSRFSFDRITGDLYLADVGERLHQEIDFQPASSHGGENYGWNIYEGIQRQPIASSSDTNGLVMPAVDLDSYLSPSITGGHIFRGPPGSRLFGFYFFGDATSGRVWGSAQISNQWQTLELALTKYNISTFGEDESGNLYLADINTKTGGRLYQLTDKSTALPPTFSPPGGYYSTEQNVHVLTLNPGADIHYTLDGREPTDTDPIIHDGESIGITTATLIKARAFRAGLEPSATASAQYNLVVALNFAPSGGSLTNGSTVSIVSSTSGTTIRYTLDGTVPGPSSPIYDRPLKLEGDVTVTAQGIKDHFNPSSVKTQYYGRLVSENVFVRTLAGAGLQGFRDGPGFLAQFSYPEGIAVDLAGNVLVADTGNHCIRRISPAGEVTCFAGTNSPGYQDGPAAMARFNTPVGICLDAIGNIYIADKENNRIRLINTMGEVSTYAGSGVHEWVDGDRQQAGFLNLGHLEMDAAGNLFAGDWARVRRISAQGEVTTLAGSGVYDSEWSGEVGIGLDPDGNAYAATVSGLLHKILSPGNSEIFAGSVPGHCDGPRLAARLDSNLFINRFTARDVVSDPQGNLYVSDRLWVRKIQTNGWVSTLNVLPRLKHGYPAPLLCVFATGLAMDRTGNLYVADAGTHSIRKISPDRDADGIPDTEEVAGSPYGIGVDDWRLDADADAQSNASEFVAGTDPRNAQSRLFMMPPTVIGDQVLLHWPSVAGRQYLVQRSNDLLLWSNSTAWMPGTGEMMSFSDRLENRQYYQVMVSLP